MTNSNIKYTIWGFQQDKLCELGLNCRDVCILRYLFDFVKSNNMKIKTINCEEMYWINYDYLLEQLPIVSIGKRQLGRLFKKYENCGVLKIHANRLVNGGTTIYFRFITNVLDELVKDYGNWKK